MSYNDGVKTSTMGLDIANSARSGGVARMNYETGIRQSDLNSAGGMGGMNAGELANGLMRWAEAGGKMTLAQKQEEEVKKRVAAAELKKAKAEQDFKNKTDAKSLFSSTGGESLETAGASGAPFLPSTEEQAKLYNANAGLRKEYEKLYTEDKIDEEQAYINAHAGDITDALFEEWEALDPEDVAKKDFIQFAGVQLQNYKEKRHLENFSGLKHLGEVTADGKGVNYTQLEDHVAKKHREHVREQQDVFITNRVVGSFNANGIPKTIADFDNRVGGWKGSRFDVNGKKGDLIPRKQVVTAVLEEMTEQVQYSLQNPNGKSTDKIFDSLEMIESLNDYNNLMDRGDGLGKKFQEYFKEARAAKTTLQNRERKAKDDAEKEGKKVDITLNNKALNEISAVKFAIDNGNPPSKDDFKLLQVQLLLRKKHIKPSEFNTSITQLSSMAKSIDVNSESYIPPEGSEEAKILPDYTQTASKEFKSIAAVGKEQEKVIQSNDPSWMKVGKLKVLEAQSKRIKYQIDNTASHTEEEKIASTNNLGGLQTRLGNAINDCREGNTDRCEVAQGIIDMVPTQGMIASDMGSWVTHKTTMLKELGTISGGKAAAATTGKVMDLIGAVNDGKNFADAEKEFKKLKNPSARDMEIFQTQTRAFRDKKADDKGIEAGLNFESTMTQYTNVTDLKAAVKKELENNKSLGFEARKNILKFQTKRILEIDKGNVSISKELAKEIKKENSQRSMVNHRTLFNELQDSASMEKYITDNNIFAKGSTVDISDQGAFQKELQGVIKETKEKEEIKVAGDQEGKIRDKLLKMEMNPTPEELQDFQEDVDKIKHEPTRTRMNAILQGYGDKTKTKEEIDSALQEDMSIRKEVRSSMTVMREKLTDFVKAAEDPNIKNSASKAMTSLLEYRKTVLKDTKFQNLMAQDPDNINYQKEMDDTYTKLSELQTKDEIIEKNETNHENNVASLRDREVKTEQTYEDIFELEENFTQESYNTFIDNLGVSAELIDKNGKVSNPSLHTAAIQDQLRLRAKVAKEEHDQKTADPPPKTDMEYLGLAEYKIDQIRDASGDAEKKRLIDEANTWLMNSYTGVPPDTAKKFATDDFRYFRNKINSEVPDAPKAFEPKTEALQIINSIFTGSVSETGSPLGGLPLGEGSTLRNDIRTYFGTQFNKNISKFKKPYMLKREPGMKDMMVVDCNTNTQVGDGVCFDDKGLEFAQQVSTMLITPSEDHPLGGGPPSEDGTETFSARLKKFKSTMLQNLQSGGSVIPQERSDPLKPGVNQSQSQGQGGNKKGPPRDADGKPVFKYSKGGNWSNNSLITINYGS